jgi:hypothetical protein
VSREDATRSRRTVAAVLALAALVDVAAAHSTVRHLVPAALLGYPFLGAAPVLLVARLPRRLQAAGWTLAAAILAACVVAPNLWLDAHAGRVFQRFTASTTEVRQAVTALEARGLRTGYTDYWSAYPITYFSGESVVLAPRLPVVWGGRFDRYPGYTDTVDAVDDLRRVFVLVDNRCSPLPYVLVLEQHDARYQAERVARWYLLWDVRAPEGKSGEILAAWREMISAHDVC